MHLNQLLACLALISSAFVCVVAHVVLRCNMPTVHAVRALCTHAPPCMEGTEGSMRIHKGKAGAHTRHNYKHTFKSPGRLQSSEK